MDDTTLAIWVIGFSIAGVSAGFSWQITKRIKEARKWPVAEATIQSAGIGRVSHAGILSDIPCFAFSYTVDEKPYSGRFALRAERDRGDSLIRAMIDKKMNIHYDPKRPEDWYIPVNTIGGCEVEQKLRIPLDLLNPTD